MKQDNAVLVDFQGLEQPQWLGALEDFCLWILDDAGYHGWEVSVLICDDTTIAGLNQEYRGKEGPTDVLSFAQEEDEEPFGPPVPGADEGLHLAGDIVVAPGQVEVNSREFGVSFDQEMKRVLIHGILHLAGHDHESNDGTEPMLRLQEEILARYKGEIGFTL